MDAEALGPTFNVLHRGGVECSATVDADKVTHLFEFLRRKVAAEIGQHVSHVPALTNATPGETNQSRGTIEVWTPQPLPAAPTCITGGWCGQ